MTDTNTTGQPPINSWADKTPAQIVGDINTALHLLGGNQPDLITVRVPVWNSLRRFMRAHERRSMSKRAFYRRRARGQLQWW